MSGLIELMQCRPLVCTCIIATKLEIMSRAAIRLIEEINLLEMTERGL
ncbi:hypothetical protein H5024_18890 [Ochrobactrum sp. Marseille-Q0166]|nr:hypothetical protein [Ochrobactrum sp. Marseille-Q0166]